MQGAAGNVTVLQPIWGTGLTYLLIFRFHFVWQAAKPRTASDMFHFVQILVPLNVVYFIRKLSHEDFLKDTY